MAPTTPGSRPDPPAHPLAGSSWVTDGGLETDLIFHHHVDLPHFAAFPLVDDEAGRSLLTDYYAGYGAVAAEAGAGLLVETPTWRANPDWAARVGYDADATARVNRDAVALARRVADEWADRVPRTRVVGSVGPRGDGYRPGDAVDPDEAAEYHRHQVAALAEGGADLVSVLTLVDVGEAVGVVRAARDVGVPVSIGFTVEVDGRLATGPTIAEAVAAVDAAAPPDHYLLNCAHPDHLEAGLRSGKHAADAWRDRIWGLRVNASTASHAELDEATELDDGDPVALAAAHRRIEPLLPRLCVVGGCCGTDVRHVAALWEGRSGRAV